MSAVFTSGETVVTLRSPEVNNQQPFRKRQAVGRTAGGTFFSYDKGIDITRMALSFTELTETMKDDLESFFDTTVEGTTNTFTYTDHDGDDWTARFLNTELTWRELATVGDGEGGTEGRWAVDLELEVTAA